MVRPNNYASRGIYSKCLETTCGMTEKKDEVVKQTLTKKESVSKQKSLSQASVCHLCVSVRERSSNKIEKDMRHEQI